MPQYPIPPGVDPDDPDDVRLTWRRQRIRSSNRRFSHLPLVKGTPDGVVHVVRGDPDLAERLGSRPEARTLFGDQVGRVHFVAENRVGDLHFVLADVQTVVGDLELFLYSSPLLLDEAIGAATTLAELRTTLSEQLARVDALLADGWELYRYPNGVQIVVDTRRPDEDLTAKDLP